MQCKFKDWHKIFLAKMHFKELLVFPKEIQFLENSLQNFLIIRRQVQLTCCKFGYPKNCSHWKVQGQKINGQILNFWSLVDCNLLNDSLMIRARENRGLFKVSLVLGTTMYNLLFYVIKIFGRSVLYKIR